jgi:hypothetical protein
MRPLLKRPVDSSVETLLFFLDTCPEIRSSAESGPCVCDKKPSVASGCNSSPGLEVAMKNGAGLLQMQVVHPPGNTTGAQLVSRGHHVPFCSRIRKAIVSFRI